MFIFMAALLNKSTKECILFGKILKCFKMIPSFIRDTHPLKYFWEYGLTGKGHLSYGTLILT